MAEELLQLRDSEKLRGHLWTLRKPTIRKGARANFFTVRVVNKWKRLPGVVPQADTIKEFKLRLDRCWPQAFLEVC